MSKKLFQNLNYLLELDIEVRQLLIIDVTLLICIWIMLQVSHFTTNINRKDIHYEQNEKLFMGRV